MDTDKLTIYKASAGSGKTFQLTREYLTILFKNPGAYKNILAVTFTNKATAEMKGRILEELAKIANNQPSSYLPDIRQSIKISLEDIKARAKTILQGILHDYSRFTVETIDNFFQRVLKSFTKELHIYFNYNLELDTSRMIDLATSRLIFNSHKNKEVKKWLTDFALEKISNGKTWNAKKDIVSLGNELFNEQFQLIFNQLNNETNNKKALGGYISACYKIITNFEEQLAKIGAEAVNTIEGNGLSADDFTQKRKGVAGYFYKLVDRKDSSPNSYVIKAYQDFENWVPKKSAQKELIERLYHDSLGGLLESALLFRGKNNEQYTSAKEILKQAYAFGILTDLYGQVREITNEQNVFLLAETGKLIHTIIENNEAPFIYEKLGNIYAHFMIDEFQDTSELQWKNFYPLVQNSLASGKKNIVVGDVKQAIYRWRNSNWNILGSKIYQQIPKGQINAVNLNKNWRSLKNIVFFNNSLYSIVSRKLQDIFNQETEPFLENNLHSNTIISAYKELKQELPGKKQENEGHVNVQFFNDENWEGQILEELPELIIKLLNQGFEQSQIALLVRNKKEGQLVIDKLIDNTRTIKKETGIVPNFLSSDALLLKSSKSVRFVLSLLKYIVSPDDEVNKVFMLKSARELAESEKLLFHAGLGEKEGSLLAQFEFEGSKLNQYSLYDLVSKIIKTFNLEKFNEKAFLAAFLDTVLDFSRNHHAGIKGFLDWWEEEGESLALNIEEAENAIQVLTIHKSKGLEFDVVVIPFCNWRIDQHASHANIMWCKPTMKPFDALPVVPLSYSRTLAETTFKEEYAFEKLNTYVDNMNLLYVATTRAKQALFIRSPHPDQIKRRGVTVSTLLLDAVLDGEKNNENGTLALPDYFDEAALTFDVGNLTSEKHIYKPEPDKLGVTFSQSFFDVDKKLKIKYNYTDFFAETPQQAIIDRGKLLHKIFEQIKYPEDVEVAVENTCLEGVVSFKEKTSLVETIARLIENGQVKEWFDKKWQVKTEAEILIPGAEQKRPDRVLTKQGHVVVIDYKFGLKESEKHIQQIEEYIALLKNMEYPVVDGYVWYVSLNKIKKVTL